MPVFFNVKVNNVFLERASLNNDDIEKPANNSTEKQANNSTEKQANNSTEKQANNSTDKQAKNSTEQQDSNSFNQARLKKEVNRRFSIPGLTSYQPTYIVDE